MSETTKPDTPTKLPEAMFTCKLNGETYSSRTRVRVLSEAIECVDSDKQKEHGLFGGNALAIASFWNTYLCAPDQFIKPRDVPIMLALMKLARCIQKPENMDNYRDAAGYVALASETNDKD